MYTQYETYSTLPIGDHERTSAKKRRQDAYKKDLQLQMLDQQAARKRERFQDMSVNASGWLDPEKGPERLKPLGGSGFMTDRTNRENKVRPYHMLFNYDKMPRNAVTMYDDRPATAGLFNLSPRARVRDAPSVPVIKSELNLDIPPALNIQPLQAPPVGHTQLPASTHDAYNFYATRDLDRNANYGSIIQPLSIPYVDNRPIIMPGQSTYQQDCYPRYNPFHNYDSIFRDIRNLIGNSNGDNERLKWQRLRDDDEFQKRMRRELEAERRRLMDQEIEARRRVEELRREAEERRREWERRLAELERNRKQPDKVTDVVVVRPPSTTLLADMEDMRRRMADERRKIEELLKIQLRAPDYTEVKVLKRPPPPPTPKDSDRADANNLREFEYLKNKEYDMRRTFRQLYPEHPDTNRRLERQQVALIRQQEDDLSKLNFKQPPQGMILVEKGYKRPSWLDKSPTPFPHRLRQRDRLYTTQSLDGELERIYRKNQRRERAQSNLNTEFDSLKLRSIRPSSAETLTDDTWLRPSSVQNF